jgi:hypothetical protein
MVTAPAPVVSVPVTLPRVNTMVTAAAPVVSAPVICCVPLAMLMVSDGAVPPFSVIALAMLDVPDSVS